MKKLKKSLMIAGAIATVGVGSLSAVGMASAANNTSGSGIIDKIAAKFNLNKDEVKAVFDANHAEQQATRTQALADRLATAVKDGKLTQAQADAITAKMKEFQATRAANHDKMQSMTAAERKATMETERAAMQKWMTDNNIPEEYARFAHMGGHGGPGHHGMMDADDAATN